MSIIHSLRSFVGAPRKDRLRKIRGTIHRHVGKLFFGLMPPAIGFMYCSYRPDAEYVFAAYPEFSELLRKWLAGNRSNNAGDLARLYAIILNVKQLLSDAVAGDFAEIGVYRGNSAAVLAHFARREGRTTFLFDTFTGFDQRDLVKVDDGRPAEFDKTSINAVKSLVGAEMVEYVVGYFPASVTANIRNRTFALAHIDVDLYQPMRDALAFFYPRLSPGGLLIVHDYSSEAWAGAKQAVDEFLKSIPERLTLLPDKSGTAVIRKCVLQPTAGASNQ